MASLKTRGDHTTEPCCTRAPRRCFAKLTVELVPAIIVLASVSLPSKYYFSEDHHTRRLNCLTVFLHDSNDFIHHKHKNDLSRATPDLSRIGNRAAFAICR